MSVVSKPGEAVAQVDTVSVTIDGIEVQVPKGTLAIRAAEMIGIAIPRFCDHPLLDPVGACRQCLVEVPDMGNGRGMPKPAASCTLEVAPGMKISTQVTSPVAEKAQAGMLEFLLINHPLDCPICDKGGECPLQNQALKNGYGESRYEGAKRTFPKPVPISAQILLDRERCVLCARCTRFSEQISGDPFISLVERGALQQVGKYAEHPYNSYFSGNVIQICPVGALTSVSYRFEARPFDLVSTESTCEHCAAGCSLRVDQRHFQVKRRLAGENPEVNEEWNCDKGRFAFVYGRGDDRLTNPLVRRDGVLKVASWAEAIDAAVAGLKAAGSSAAVLTGGRLTVENAYGYAKFARTVLGTNNIDFRSRPASAEETDFLTTEVAGRAFGDGVTYADLETAGQVVLVCLEPEEESAAIFLRLRKAVRKNKLKVVTLAPFATNGSVKLDATVVATEPGQEATALAGVSLDPDTIVLVGERAALSPGTLAAVAARTAATGARFAWVPRRAGDRGAVEAGCLPTLLPGGRPVADTAARVDVAAAWGVDSLPSEPGLDAAGILAAVEEGTVRALVVAGVEPRDFAWAGQVRNALESADFVVSLESRLSEVTERADVVFPIALVEEHAGTFLNWEHRPGTVNTVVKRVNAPMTDLRVLAALADALGSPLGVRTVDQAAIELGELGLWDGPRSATPSAPPVVASSNGGYRLATWRELLDGGRGMDNEPALAATAKPAIARVSPATAQAEGLVDGELVTVTTGTGSFSLPLAVEPGMVDGTVWVPTNSPAACLGEYGVLAGDPVQLSPGGVA